MAKLAMARSRKDVQELVDWAAERGWSVGRTKKDHMVFRKEGCTPVYAGGSPSDHRSKKNAMAQMRRNERAAEEAGCGC